MPGKVLKSSVFSPTRSPCPLSPLLPITPKSPVSSPLLFSHLYVFDFLFNSIACEEGRFSRVSLRPLLRTGEHAKAAVLLP